MKAACQLEQLSNKAHISSWPLY